VATEQTASRKRRLTWWAVSLIAVQLVLVGATLLVTPNADPALLSGFRGNLLGGVLTSALFLVIGLYFGEDLGALQAATHDLVHEREQREEQQRKVRRFLDFLEHEGYHDIRLPGLKTELQPLGLEYRATPVRDEDGKPRVMQTEMETRYFITVEGPSYADVRPKEHLDEYDDAPIRTGEAYYCQFFNSAWHMFRELPEKPYEFYLSGKVGPTTHEATASEYLGIVHPPAGTTRLCRFLVAPDGSLMKEAGGCFPVEVYIDEREGLYLKVGDAPVKRVRRERDADSGADFFVIENFHGYFTGRSRENFRSALDAELRRALALR
jgi:hypothetical protein